MEADPDLQVVVCTTCPAGASAEMLEKLGKSGRLLILKQPFDPIEVRLLAATLSEKWNASYQSREDMCNLEEWAVDAERVLDVLQRSYDELEASHLSATIHATELARLVQQRTVEALAARDVAVLMLAKLAESRDPETGEHLERMRAYTKILGEYLTQDGPYTEQTAPGFLADLCRSSPLHDIGKVGIPDAILLKPGPLTFQEFEVMKRHTVIGADALQQASKRADCGMFLEMAARISRSHHERFDGSGYPDGLSGPAIPLEARIVALADVFDALTSARVYKDAMDPEVARLLIEKQEEGHFDPAVLEAFNACYDDFLKVHADSHGDELDLLKATDLPRGRPPDRENLPCPRLTS